MKDLSYYKSKRFAYTTIVAAIFITTVFYFGMKDPKVIVAHGKFEVKGIYGFIADIKNLKVDTVSSLPEISMRTNGFAGGGVLKGKFTLTNDEKVLLFARRHSQPFIRIMGSGERTVYISYKDPDQTRTLFNKLKP